MTRYAALIGVLMSPACFSGSPDPDPSSPAPDPDAAAGSDSEAETYDLDGDGVAETVLAIEACPGDDLSTCLSVASPDLGERAIQLAGHPARCAGLIEGRRLQVIGDHAGDALHEVAAVYCPDLGDNRTPPTIAIVDVGSGEVVGRASAPETQIAAFIAFPRDPDARLHPVLAPSYGDGAAEPIWGYLCVYRPGRVDPRCGGGFASVSTVPATPFFREVGGVVQDLDGDGWEDVSLPFRSIAYVVSINTERVLSQLTYDVASATEPGSPTLFHRGRNDGTQIAFAAEDGKLRTVLVGGAPVGSFSDPDCNVSRFVAALDSPPGRPGERRLAWSRYYGYGASTFSQITPASASNPAAVLARPPDVMHGCVHRFSDSISVMDGAEVVVFDYFLQDAPVDRCLVEEYALELPPAGTADKLAAWRACQARNLKATGTWGMQVLRARDGAALTGSLATYIWGATTRLFPGGERLYLVEALPSKTAFDLSDQPAHRLSVRALVDGLWAPRGGFPIAGRPALNDVPADRLRGVGSYTRFSELVAADRDGDGLDELQLEDGRWVGWSAAGGGGLVIKL